MITGFSFLKEEELLQLHKEAIENNQKIVLWGMGLTVLPIVNTLNYLGVKLDYWGTGTLGQKSADGREVLTYDDMNNHKDDIVIIGSFAYVPIYKKLKDIGVKQIYGVRDVFKYPLSEHVSDRNKLKEYFNERSCKNSNKILIELYGNIGDVIVRIGIVKRFIKNFGRDNIYVLFSNNENADVYRLITDNIIILSDEIIDDERSRLIALEKINSIRFDASYILCDTRLYALRRVLNKYNCNISEIHYSDGLPFRDYLLGIDIDNIQDVLGTSNKNELTGWNRLLVDDLKNVKINHIIDDKYVAVNLGASKVNRQYPVELFTNVCEYLINKGYKIALLGHGNHDEYVSKTLLSNEKIREYITDFVSELRVSQAAKVISDATFFIGTESGMWNLSYILGKPSVVIYGGGDYGNFYHTDGIIKYAITKELPCYNCKWFCDKADEHGVAKCIRDITPEQIIKCVDELISEIY